MLQKPNSAYFHIPFCSHICYYCDFAKVLMTGQPIDAYIESLIEEFQSFEIEKLRTIYIGGGTPSVLSAQQLERLLTAIAEQLDLEVLEEFTVEANPGDLSDEVIKVLADSAVNRISLGVQTFNDVLLKKIGRTHTEVQVYDSVERLKKAGFENITIDLIYALPGQTMEMVKSDVEKFLELKLPHVALYSLILEDHTVFMNRQRRGLLRLPSEDKNADMYEYIMDILAKNGYNHYEVSNFGLPGFESKHNITYWDNEEYYGIGAGASGYLAGIRYKNLGPVHHYLTAAPTEKRVNEEVLSKKSQIEEFMFLGLRKMSGVSNLEFKRRFGRNINDIYQEIIEELLEQELIQLTTEGIALTHQGKFLGNNVFQAFLLED